MQRFMLWCCALGMVMVLPLGAVGADKAKGRRIHMKILEVKYHVQDTTDRDPNTKGLNGLANMGTSRNKGWGVITVRYATAPLWIDDVNLRLYALLGTAREPVLLSGNTSYFAVPKGEAHMAYSFIHPNITTRYGEVQRVRAELWYNGVLEHSYEWPEKSSVEWWNRIRPLTGALWTKFYTPFERLAQAEEPIRMEEK